MKCQPNAGNVGLADGFVYPFIYFCRHTVDIVQRYTILYSVLVNCGLLIIGIIVSQLFTSKRVILTDMPLP